MMIRWWRRFHELDFRVRGTVKTCVFLVVVLLVLYPRPGLLRRHIGHWRQAEVLPDMLDDAFIPVLVEYRQWLAERGVPAAAGEVGRADDLLSATDEFVRGRIPYAWDWDTWGVVDYLPSVGEVLAMGREDCDGRAVLAAALLRSLNLPAHLASDGKHVWVRTPLGDTMSPTGKPALVSGPEGMRITWLRLFDPGILAVGVSLFPLGRELIILITLWLLCLRPGLGKGHAALAGLLLVDGLLMLRMAGVDPWDTSPWAACWAIAHWLAVPWVLIRHGPLRAASPGRPTVTGGS